MPDVRDKVAGVVIDSWKLPIFKLHIEEGGFLCNQHSGITPLTLTLKVPYAQSEFQTLANIIKKANGECADAQRNSH